MTASLGQAKNNKHQSMKSGTVLFQESVVIANLGQAKKRPVLKMARDHYMRLEYTDGAACPDGGAGARYNTTIHFLCVKGQQVFRPFSAARPPLHGAVWVLSEDCRIGKNSVKCCDSLFICHVLTLLIALI